MRGRAVRHGAMRRSAMRRGPQAARVLERTRSAFDHSVAAAGADHEPRTAAILEATKWFAPEDRDARHDAILDVLVAWDVRSVLEVGAGAGDFYTRLKRRLPAAHAYTGVDLSPRMVEVARRRFGGADFRRADILDWPAAPVADAVVAIGVFALLVDEAGAHWRLMKRLVRKMLALSRTGVVFDFYDFFTDEEAKAPARYFADEQGRTDDTPIYCVRPRRVRRFAAELGPVALMRIHEVEGRVWRCVLRRPPRR
jgi:SAM-dependent methyltransferase